MLAEDWLWVSWDAYAKRPWGRRRENPKTATELARIAARVSVVAHWHDQPIVRRRHDPDAYLWEQPAPKPVEHEPAQLAVPDTWLHEDCLVGRHEKQCDCRVVEWVHDSPWPVVAAALLKAVTEAEHWNTAEHCVRVMQERLIARSTLLPGWWDLLRYPGVGPQVRDWLLAAYESRDR